MFAFLATVHAFDVSNSPEGYWDMNVYGRGSGVVAAPPANGTKALQGNHCTCAGRGWGYPNPGEYALSFTAPWGKSSACTGGCSGTGFISELPGQYITQIILWDGARCGDVKDSAITKMCWTFSNGVSRCVGGNREGCGSNIGTSYSYTFSEGETLSTFTMRTNSYPAQAIGRVRQFSFTTLKKDGSSGSFTVGPSWSPEPWYATKVQGMVIAGFLGLASGDVNQLGVFVQPPNCQITRREITNVECVDKSGVNCLATWKDAGHMISVNAGCNNCDSRTPASCDFTFSYSVQNTVTTTSTSIDELGVGVSFGVELSVGIEEIASVKASRTIDINYKHTWEESKSTSTSTTGTVGSTCHKPVDAGESAVCDGAMRAGSLTADLRMTVTAYTACGGKQHTLHPATVTVNNVPGLGDITSCTFRDGTCPSSEMAAPALRLE